MFKRVLGLAAIPAAIAFSASIAFAGTYVTGPLPSEFVPTFPKNAKAFVPPNSKLFANINKAASNASKLASSIAKCYSKSIGNFSKNKPTGLQTCLKDTKKGVIPKYVAGVQKQESKAPGLPDCHNYALDAGLIHSLVKQFIPQHYCASPSGAFLDGVVSF
jgi:hypothetical protein